MEVLMQTSQPQMGIVIPPDEIRKIVEKTAEFVAKNGSSFEDLVIKAESNNNKFSFLKKDDPYRNFYDSKVNEFIKQIQTDQQTQIQSTIEARAQEINQASVTQQPIINEKIQEQQTMQVNETQEKLKIQLRKDLKEIKPPAQEKYTINLPTNMTYSELDIIKLTAQFVAKNGQKFLIELTEREKSNPQFDFLKPTHMRFSFFTSLVESYSKCLVPKKDDIQQLQEYVLNWRNILANIENRFEYNLQQMEFNKKKDEDEEEIQRQLAEIDWDDFVVVETINLFDDEQLLNTQPNPEQVKQQQEPKKAEIQLPSLPQMPQMPQIPQAQELKDKENQAGNVASGVVEMQPLNEEKFIKKEEYVPKPVKQEVATCKCEICGRQIPVNEYNEHLKIELMDPKHMEIVQMKEERMKKTTQADELQFTQSLQKFAQQRKDIFGAGDDSLADPQKRVKKADQQGTQPMVGQLDTKSLPIATNQNAPTFLPSSSNLIPESKWLEMNPGRIMLNIKIHEVSNDFSDLQSFSNQTLKLQIDVASKIIDLKLLISQKLGNLEEPYIKLFFKSNLVLNKNTLAFYNVGQNSIIDLHLKK